MCCYFSDLDRTSSLLKSECKVIPIIGDGRCFFRCLALCLDKSLQQCQRSSSGIVYDRKQAMEEVRLADLIRQETVELISANSSSLEAISVDLPYMLDSQVNMSYASLQDRCLSMTKAEEYAGTTEILTAAFIWGVQICIYVESKSDVMSYDLYAKIPPSRQSNFNFSTINILHRIDTKSQDGHFMLLQVNGEEPVMMKAVLKETLSEFFYSVSGVSNSSSVGLSQVRQVRGHLYFLSRIVLFGTLFVFLCIKLLL